MKIINCEQGGATWFNHRLGKPTASHFGELVTPLGTPRKGAALRAYAIELLTERLTGYPAQHFETDAMRRGVELEPAARKWYSLVTDARVHQVGFIASDCGRWGASPDGIIADKRGLEIKCPGQNNFVAIAESRQLPDDHLLQVQAALWITGYAQWDYVLFTDCRGLVPQIIEVRPDKAIHNAFAEILPRFCETLDKMEATMRGRGHGQYAKQEIEHDAESNPFAGLG